MRRLPGLSHKKTNGWEVIIKKTISTEEFKEKIAAIVEDDGPIYEELVRTPLDRGYHPPRRKNENNKKRHKRINRGK